MRIIYLHQYFNTPEMSGGTRSYEMARRLVSAGHEVEIITTWRESDEKSGWFQTEEDGLVVHWQCIPYSNHMGFAERILAFLKFAWGASRFAARRNADIVFATSTPLTIAIPGIYSAWRLGAPLVFEIRDVWPDVPIALGVLKNPILKWLGRTLEKFTYRYATRIVALAPGMKNAIVAKGVDPDKIDVIPNGADLDLFGNDDQDANARNSFLQQNGVPENSQLILYAGTIGSVNNVDYIVSLGEIVHRLQPDPPVAFVILGDGIERPALEAAAQQSGVLNRTVFFLGPKPKREVALWYQCCTASLMTYNGPEVVYRDSVSNKFFDSLAASKPVLANFRGFSTIVAEEASAGAILSTKPTEAASELLEMLADDAWITQSGRNARELGEQRFSRDMLADQLALSLERASEV